MKTKDWIIKVMLIIITVLFFTVFYLIATNISNISNQDSNKKTSWMSSSTTLQLQNLIKLSANSDDDNQSEVFVAYYNGHAAYSGITPEQLDLSGVNILNYAFAKIDADYTVQPADSNIDLSNIEKINQLKSEYPLLRTVISIGGWENSNRFSDAVLSESSRIAFVNSAIEFVTKYDFDGIDIDWEYPTGGGLTGNVSRAADSENFTLLLKLLRNKLDDLGTKNNKHYILSFAGSPNSSFTSNVDLQEISQYVDYALVMTYGLHGSWDIYTDFASPLYLPSQNSPQYTASVDQAIQLWLDAGFPSNKLVMGVPFFGNIYHDVDNVDHGLFQEYTFSSSLRFREISSNYLTNKSYVKYYDNSTCTPYLFNGSTFISYDDANSIQQKITYLKGKKLLGVGVWDLSGDDSAHTLTKVVKESLNDN